MFAVVRRTFFAFVLVLVVLMTGAWQKDQVALAQSQSASLPDAPLYPGLTWSGPSASAQDIRINTDGDSVSLSGERYAGQEQFPAGLPQEVLDYYSNRELAKSGWSSYDAFDGPDGVHYVFEHESGVYLSVEFLKCPEAPSSTCVAVWISEQVQAGTITPGGTSEPGSGADKATFGKTSPYNGQTGLDAASITFSWQAYAGADKYKYCVQQGSACAKDDTDWTSTYSRSITLHNFDFNRTYYWHVKATTCELCVPKPWVYSDNDTPWSFRTRTGTGSQVTILGNAGVGGAVLSFVDGSARSVTADSAGSYSLRVSYGWSGTVTPSKPGYVFSPASASFTNLTATQTIQNFAASAIYVISGNAGLPGVTLSYVNGTPQTVVSDASGNYSIVVPAGWSGTVTPSKPSYVFSPVNRTYSNLAANQTAQNYTASLATFTISGNTGVGSVTLRYFNGTPRSILSDASGNYSITVPFGWSGTVTPSKTAYLFTPANRAYTNVIANQTAQNYTATPLYTISGNTGAAGTTLSYTDGTPRTVTALSDGSYSLTVPSGWTGSVTPTHACFTFTPANRNYTNLASSQTSQNFTAALKAGCADVSVLVGGANQGRFGLPSPSSTRASFRLNDGPVKIASSNGIALIAAERVIYQSNNIKTSFSEMMGLPSSQLDRIYWLPWYNNVDLDTQLRIANVSGSSATVHLLIHGVEMTTGCTSNSPFNLAAGESVRVSCSGVNNGPVKIESNQNIVASERLIYRANGVNTSFSELLALPNSQVSNTYWLPWYNNVDLDTQIRFANLSTTQQATVHVTIAGQEVNGSPFLLPAGESTRVSLAGVNNGPVKIESNQNLVATERVIYNVNGVNTSFSEMMALPSSQVNNTYWLPWYNNADLDTQIRFANLSTTQQATVHITVAGQEVNGSPFVLQAGASTRVSLPGVNDGPVKIQSSQNLVVTERVIYRVSGVNTSFSEMMALPNSQLDTTFWLPWYNNIDIDTQLRFGRP